MNVLYRLFSAVEDPDFILPGLAKLQNDSCSSFMSKLSEQALDCNIFSSIFPIDDSCNRARLEFVSCNLGDPYYNDRECIYRGLTYSVSVKAILRLVVYEDEDEEDVANKGIISSEEKDDNLKVIKDIKEQEVHIGELPIITPSGTFVINGIERVAVSQVHRAPGPLFDVDRGRSSASDKLFYIARIIPYKGSWLDFEFDNREVLYFRIDKKRKLPLTYLLRIMGYDNDGIYSTFYESITCISRLNGEFWEIPFSPEQFKGVRLKYDLFDIYDKSIILRAGSKINAKLADSLYSKRGLKSCYIDFNSIVGLYSASKILIGDEVIANTGDEITVSILERLKSCDACEISILSVDIESFSPYIRNTLSFKDVSYEEALVEVCRVLRPGEVVSMEVASSIIDYLFFNSDRYDLLPVGRIRLNAKLGLSIPEEFTVLTKDDIIHVIKYLVNLQDGRGEIDDIDHLGNRRIRSVGEFIENQFRSALVKIQRVVLEQFSVADINSIAPCDLVNSKIMTSVLKEFFISSSLSQFMDQTNPLAEITHKRRLSALGPGGLTKERAGFEVRDVHTTHYGRICPIETPEGQNIGLISSLAIYARVNKYGFIETPYRKVLNGVLTSEIVYLSAIDELGLSIAQSDITINSDGSIASEVLSCRRDYEFSHAKKKDINYIDISPKQIVSVAASLIPFLANDDANRALMGSNMQRQAVPLLNPEFPVIGTGMEGYVARGSGAVEVARRSGVVEYVDASYIVIRSVDRYDPWVDSYELRKFEKSNHSTCINFHPIVSLGDFINKGDVIADGPSAHNGELALGRNLIVAFIAWYGYNFEDSILISSNVIKDDFFTSIHIEEFECVVRDTRLGPEEITRDIPNVPEDLLCNLDEFGIVNIGSKVSAGDVLVGKITPKSESSMNAEEKLLRAIFGEKSIDIKDSSLYVSPGVSGTVMDVRIFVRRGIEKGGREILIDQQRITNAKNKRDHKLSIFSNYIYDTLRGYLLEAGRILDDFKEFNIFKGAVIDDELLNRIPRDKWWAVKVSCYDTVAVLRSRFDKDSVAINAECSLTIDKISSSDELAQGVLTVVKIFVVVRHELQPGDKMSGRHGNKGVISRIIPAEDMPYLEDGTPIDIILNPLGVPSRMNVGQIMETNLGWGAFKLGRRIYDIAFSGDYSLLRSTLMNLYEDSSFESVIQGWDDDALVEYAKTIKNGVPIAAGVFESPTDSDFKKIFDLAGVDPSGQEVLYDGLTGEPFDRKVTVGMTYILKLHHLVDDKIHARSVGPYSLITQQPLGGKSHFGGQRFGEMECWALQAYGAAYTLQEMLTVKSDDVVGRVKIYESIIKGEHSLECGIPESFNVMVNELRALCLNVEFKISNHTREDLFDGCDSDA